MAFDLASFKNSRQYGRKATTQAVTDEMTINSNAGPVSLVAAADVNRTYLTIFNKHATDSLRYWYTETNVAPALVDILADGFELPAGSAIDVESPQYVWAVSQTANPIPIDTDQGTG